MSCAWSSSVRARAGSRRAVSARAERSVGGPGLERLRLHQGIASATALGAVLGGLQTLLPESAHAADDVRTLLTALPAPQAAFDLAQDTPIWENIVRYAQYFFSVMLGTGYVMLKPFAQLLRNPLTGVLVVGGAVGLVVFVKTTVNAMLGVDDLFEYAPTNAMTPLQ